MPVKSGFEQVHSASGVRRVELAEIPFFIRVVAASAGTIWILRTQPRQRR
jgi:hypothetical protein